MHTEAQNVYKESLKFNVNCHQTNNTLIKQLLILTLRETSRIKFLMFCFVVVK